MDDGRPGGSPDDDRPDDRPEETYAWPLIALLAVILPQVLVPSGEREGPPLVVPLIEGFVLLVLVAVAARPGPVPRSARPLVLSLVAVLIVANTAAAARLLVVIVRPTPAGQEPATVTQLIVGAAIVLTTNIVTFGLCYWQLDGGGPSARLGRPRPYPDFQFPQTGSDGLAAPGWRPRFPDHLYVAFTNAIALSPTDTMPLTHRVKALMAVQSLISVSVIGVVLSRVINILPS